MKIGIFETEHFEGAYPVIKLFDNGLNDITIFTYDHSYRQFQYLFGDELNKHTWIIKASSVSKAKFIREMYTEVKQNEIEVMYFNTISNNFILYAFAIALLKQVRVIVTLHNVNNFFHLKPALTLRRWVRFFGKRLLLKTVKEFNVVSSTMVDYLKSKLPSYKYVHCVPGAIFEEHAVNKISTDNLNPLKIVVPGTLDVRRRNYAIVFELLKKINEKRLAVSIVLLGGSNECGKQILENSREYGSKNDNLRFYETAIVDQPEFDRVMNEAHFVFTPALIHTVLQDEIAEVYGKTTSSGNIFDVIKHAKPFIAPAELAIPENIESSCYRYTSPDQIISFFEELLTSPEQYQRWSNLSLQNSRHYTVEKIRQRNASLFL
jgi:hypothetical protein